MKLSKKADLHKHGVPRSEEVSGQVQELTGRTARILSRLIGCSKCCPEPTKCLRQCRPAYIADGRGLVATGTLHGAVRQPPLRKCIAIDKPVWMCGVNQTPMGWHSFGFCSEKGCYLFHKSRMHMSSHHSFSKALTIRVCIYITF
jgi:hypothetical protein